MKKKIWILISGLLILLLFFNVLNVQGADSFGLNPEQIENTTTKITASWDYLSKEWKTILLGNSFVKGADSFFQSINIVFLVLFNTDYSMSLKLLLIVALWIVLIIISYNLLKNFLSLSSIISLGISLAIVISIAHFNWINDLIDIFMWFFFAQKTWWTKLIIGAAIAIIITTIFVLIKKFGKRFKERMQRDRDEVNRSKLEAGAIASEGLTGT
jgi:hypothetical protein